MLVCALHAYPVAYVYADESTHSVETSSEVSETTEKSSNESEEHTEEGERNDTENEEIEENDSEEMEVEENTEENEVMETEEGHDSENVNGAEDGIESIDLTEATSTIDVEELEEVQEILEETIEELEDEHIETSSTTSTSTGPVIQSGTAVAMANILNIVNTSVVNSSGAIVFANLMDGETGDIDLRDNTSTSSGQCIIFNCGDDVNLNMLNDAYIHNLIHVTATSGDNGIYNGDNPVIESGDAYAGVNLVNIANTNLVNSNYLLVTLNAFQGVQGDIVFPSLNTFFRSLATAPIGDVVFHGEAQVDNNVSTDTESGQNLIENANESTIISGDSHSSTNVFNQINSNFIGGGNVSILFRVHGNWVGDVFGAPESLMWSRGEDGSIFMFDTHNGGVGSAGDGETNVNATSTVDITNDVAVVALTGKNEIDGANTALITTGNAYAGANIVNIANTNVIGRNWMLAIINIFGDFDGNIAFGRPDLWIGEQVSAPSSVRNGTEVTYKYTIINNGDSEATNITLQDEIDNDYIEVLSSTLAYKTNDQGDLEWNIESLPAGAATEISYTARIENTGYETDITNTVTVQARETDDNHEDNTDTATIRTDGRPSRERAEVIIVPDEEGEEEKENEEIEKMLGYFEVKRENKHIILEYPNHTAVQNVTIINESDYDIPSVIVHDVLTDENGAIIQDEVWDLGTVLAHEEIAIAYDIQFTSYAHEGVYTLSTYITSGNNAPRAFEENGTIIFMMPQVLPEESMFPLYEEGEEYATSTINRFNEVISSLVPTAEAGIDEWSGGVAEGNLASAGYYGFRSYAYMVAIVCFGLVIALIFGTDVYHYFRKR